MTRTEQRRFIRELVRNVERDLLKSVPRIPAHWDGHELRAYIRERFAEVDMRTLQGARKREYRSAVFTLNLL